MLYMMSMSKMLGSCVLGQKKSPCGVVPQQNTGFKIHPDIMNWCHWVSGQSNLKAYRKYLDTCFGRAAGQQILHMTPDISWRLPPLRCLLCDVFLWGGKISFWSGDGAACVQASHASGT